MISPPHPDDVIRDLGDKAVMALVDATRISREELAEYRELRPGWVADHCERGLANWINDRIWANLRRQVDGLPDVILREEGSTREVFVGDRFRARIKRHRDGDRISSYPTKASLAYWAQTDIMIPGLEEIRLGFGYRWNAEERTMGATVVSLRDGQDETPIWAVVVDTAQAGGATVITTSPVDPSLPQIDLSSEIDRTSDEETS
ncbi:hypothetical protein ABZ345_34225 [Lentzea sp. NPDC005914]|uniref:hypothetical protein n=1 Tax=Lentzea sp. NPDC005914 TaxID=3154572 RepID=UPI0033EE0CD4